MSLSLEYVSVGGRSNDGYYRPGGIRVGSYFALLQCGGMLQVRPAMSSRKGVGFVEEIRVVLWGMGAMGVGLGRILHGMKGVRLVGGIDTRPGLQGRDLGHILGLGVDLGVAGRGDARTVLKGAGGDVCIQATSSMVREVTPQILTALDCGYDVITIAEEMSFPASSDPGAADEIHSRAIQCGRTVLGTGINPGFILDTLIMALTSACTGVTQIRARRVNDLSPFGPTVMRTQGVGTTPEEFARGLDEGTIVGHVGFNESIYLIAGALGWELTRIDQVREPIIAAQERRGDHVVVPPGRVAGCNHSAVGYVGDNPVITLEHPQQVQPGAAGVETGDFIEIEGTPHISMAIQPEIPGGIGTGALATNMLAAVIAAPPGLKTMADLPVPRAVLGDVRRAVEILREQTSFRG